MRNGNVLIGRVSEICVKRICVNQEVDVCSSLGIRTTGPHLMSEMGQGVCGFNLVQALSSSEIYNFLSLREFQLQRIKKSLNENARSVKLKAVRVE